jgi:hypothetical protein
MEEKTYTLNIRQTGPYQYEVTVPTAGATKTAPMLDSALTIALHDILKHLTAHSLIMVFADQHVDRDGRSVDPQTGLEHQAVIEIAQIGIAPQVKRSERHLIFELSRPLTREQATWLNEHVGKLFDRYSIKNELEVQFDALREEAHYNRKAVDYK